MTAASARGPGGDDAGTPAGAVDPARRAVDRYERTGDVDALAEGIRVTRAVLREAAAEPDGSPAGAARKLRLDIDLAVLLSTWGDAAGDDDARGEGLRSLGAAVSAARAAAGAEAARELSRALASWAGAVLTEYERTGAPALLTQARALARQAVDAAAPGTIDRSDALSALAGALIREYQDTGSWPAVDDAVATLRDSVALAERGDDPRLEHGQDPDLDAKIHKLAVALNLRATARPGAREAGAREADGPDRDGGADRSAAARDHAEAVALLRAVAGRTPPGSPQYPKRLAALATVLHDGHEEFGTDTADESLALAARAHAAAPAPTRALYAADHAAALLGGFQRTGDQAVLDEAVALLTGAAAAPGLADPALALLETRLGAVLTTRYVQFGDPADLEAAVAALGRARTHNALRGPDRVQAASDLGAALHEVHVRSGQPAQLQEAIEVLEAGRREAGSSRTRVFRSLLANLGAVYLGHHEVFGDRESLDSAIGYLDEAVAGTGRTQPAWQASRGRAYQARYLLSDDAADLERALAALREAAATLVREPATRRTVLGNLAEALRLRALLGQPDAAAAWAEAASVAEASLDGAAAPHERALRLSNLGALLMDSNDAIPDPGVRRRAVSCLREAASASQPDDPRRTVYLANLAAAYFTVGTDDAPPMSPPAIARARAALREAAGAAAGAPQHRVWAAYTWAQLACKSGDLDEAIEAFRIAIALIPEMAGQRLARHDRERHLAGLSELARDAAACALEYGDPAQAVEFLEHGRGILIADVQHDVQDDAVLSAQRPDLAGRLRRAEGELAALNASDRPAAASRRQRLAADRAAVIAEIRACGVAGLTDFRRPPTLAELVRPLPGPVVMVNVSGYRSDALIFDGRRLRVLPCPGLTPDALHEHLARLDQALAAATDDTGPDHTPPDHTPPDHTAPDHTGADHTGADAAWAELEDAFHGAARWLWDVLVGPVLDQLGLTEDLGIAVGAGDPRRAPRVWWVPTGELARFPLHAAGYHGLAGSTARSAFARVVSSYATSLTSLRRAVTSRAPEHPPDGAVPAVLAVAMPHTPALGPAGDLGAAVAEAAVVARHFPMAVTLSGPGATRAAVLAAIRSAHIAHFGCHATIVPADPSRGRLLVHDGAVVIAELQALPAWRRGLAFLSACDTASARGDIPDEFVHLASAFQVIGFEHVVGTAWQVPDDIALTVAGGFYARLGDVAAGQDADPAAALHASVAAALAAGPRRPFPWAYVHYGADSTAPLPGPAALVLLRPGHEWRGAVCATGAGPPSTTARTAAPTPPRSPGSSSASTRQRTPWQATWPQPPGTKIHADPRQ